MLHYLFSIRLVAFATLTWLLTVGSDVSARSSGSTNQENIPMPGGAVTQMRTSRRHLPNQSDSLEGSFDPNDIRVTTAQASSNVNCSIGQPEKSLCVSSSSPQVHLARLNKSPKSCIDEAFTSGAI